MNITVRHIHSIDPATLESLKEFIAMPVVSDKLAEIDAKVDAVVTLVTDLKAKIAEAPTAEDVAKFAAISSKLDAILNPPAPEA